MESNNNRKIKNSYSNEKLSPQKKAEKKNYSKFIKTNLYLNDCNCYTKNMIKMSKFREEKYKDNKKKTKLFQQNNILPKMLYSNKYLNDEEKKEIKETKTSGDLNLYDSIKIFNGNYLPPLENSKNNTERIERAITTRKLEEKSKSHVKKTIRMFEDLLQYVDNFKIPNRVNKSGQKMEMIKDDNKLNEIINDEDGNDEEEEYKVEKYNFDEFKKKYQKEKKDKFENKFKTPRNEKIIMKNFSQNFDSLTPEEPQEKIYLTLDYKQFGNIKKNNNMDNMDNINNINNRYPSSNEKAIQHNIKTEKKDRRNLKIATIISDDFLLNQIKNIGRNFKNTLYFDNYGRFKFTDQGLNYPLIYNKFKKIPDYQGKDTEEKKVFKYRSDVIYPKYNYTNIGSFNEKFNHDLSDISNTYGKEESKGRFLLNPLMSICRKYIPEYDQYKNIKSIENKYNIRNKYKFKLKPLVNIKKGNFDRLAKVIYQKEHKNDVFNI
jgi:hypothetical protein